MQVNKYYRHHSRYPSNSELPLHKVTHRNDRSIPGMLPARDVWVFAEDANRDPDRVYMTIKNPSKGYRNAYSQ